MARLNFACQLAQRSAFRRARPGLPMRTQERLQKLRHENQTAEQQNSKHEHHQVRTCKIETFEHTDIDDRRFLKQLLQHQ
jgi:hypothetical protein